MNTMTVMMAIGIQGTLRISGGPSAMQASVESLRRAAPQVYDVRRLPGVSMPQASRIRGST